MNRLHHEGELRRNYGRNYAKLRVSPRNCEFSSLKPGVVSDFFSKPPLSHGACPGLRGGPRGPAGMWDVNRPAYPADMGDGPGSASGAGVAGATPAARCGPKRGMP